MNAENFGSPVVSNPPGRSDRQNKQYGKDVSAAEGKSGKRLPTD